MARTRVRNVDIEILIIEREAHDLRDCGADETTVIVTEAEGDVGDLPLLRVVREEPARVDDGLQARIGFDEVDYLWVSPEQEPHLGLPLRVAEVREIELIHLVRRCVAVE
jgi:hypothetical protein